VHEICYDVAEHIAKQLPKIGPFELLFDGDSNNGIPPCRGRCGPARTRPTRSSISPIVTLARLASRGVHDGAQHPRHGRHAHSRPPRIQRDMADALLDDLRRSVDTSTRTGRTQDDRRRGRRLHALVSRRFPY